MLIAEPHKLQSDWTSCGQEFQIYGKYLLPAHSHLVLCMHAQCIVSGGVWEMSLLVTLEQIGVGSSNLVKGSSM